MRQRSYDRLAAVFSIGLLAVLAAFTYYLAEFGDPFGQAGRTRTLAHEPDYFVEGLAVTRLDDAGEPLYRISAVRLVHYADDDTSEFVAPRMVSLDPQRPTVVVTAQRATAGPRGRVTDLFGDVVLDRAAFGTSPPIRVQTERLRLLMDEDIARTDGPVRITSEGSSLTGVGMEFNNAARVLTLKSKVRGVWSPPAR